MVAVLFSFFLAVVSPATAQESSETPVFSANKALIDAYDAVGPLDVAPVVVNGEDIFKLIGVSSYPADHRARKVAKRITRLAQDPTFDPKSIKIISKETHNEFFGSDLKKPFLSLYDEDAATEGVDRQVASEGGQEIHHQDHQVLPQGPAAGSSPKKT